MEQPCVSVIIPVYNVEKYVRKCVDSVLNQTYRNIQIIAVNDGSTDSSADILASYDDPRLQVINKENGGLSSARNTGLEHACGEYVLFLDSDDIIHQKLVEICVTNAKENNVDLVLFDLLRFGDGDVVDALHVPPIKANVLNRDEAIECLYAKETLVTFTVACSKLYSRKIYSKIHFPVGRLHEDVAVALTVLYSCHSVAYVNIPLYFYRSNPASITNTPGWNHLDGLVFYEQHYRFLKEQNHPAALQALTAAFKTAVSNLCAFHSDPKKRSSKRYKLLLRHCQHLARRCDTGEYGVKDRLVTLCFQYAPHLAVIMYSLALKALRC